VAVAVTVVPIKEGLRWLVSICEPTVVCPSSRCGATAFIAAFSIRATIAGVASTSISPEPRAMAVFVESTTVVDVYTSPIFIIFVYFFTTKILLYW
jgi:hypothetical protein